MLNYGYKEVNFNVFVLRFVYLVFIYFREMVWNDVSYRLKKNVFDGFLFNGFNYLSII